MSTEKMVDLVKKSMDSMIITDSFGSSLNDAIRKEGLRQRLEEKINLNEEDSLSEERKASSTIVKAFLAKKKAKAGKNSHTDGQALYLHDNKIAHHGDDGSIHATLAGWPTKTTRERLNALSGAVGGKRFYQTKNKQYYGDQEIDSHETVKLKEGKLDEAMRKAKPKEDIKRLVRKDNRAENSGREMKRSSTNQDKPKDKGYGSDPGDGHYGDVNESLRLLATHGEGSKIAKVYRDKEWEEYRVKHYTDGKHNEKADYHTNDKEDAHSTAKHWVSSKNMKEETELHEVSKDLLRRYISKASTDVQSRNRKGASDAKGVHKLIGKNSKRLVSMFTAVEKIKKKEAIVNEDTSTIEDLYKRIKKLVPSAADHKDTSPTGIKKMHDIVSSTSKADRRKGEVNHWAYNLARHQSINRIRKELESHMGKKDEDE